MKKLPSVFVISCLLLILALFLFKRDCARFHMSFTCSFVLFGAISKLPSLEPVCGVNINTLNSDASDNSLGNAGNGVGATDFFSSNQLSKILMQESFNELRTFRSEESMWVFNSSSKYVRDHSFSPRLIVCPLPTVILLISVVMTVPLLSCVWPDAGAQLSQVDAMSWQASLLTYLFPGFC